MPNYVAHSVMGEVVDIPNNRLDFDKKELGVYALGQDLMLSDKYFLDIVHNSEVANFFNNLISYIIENKLYDDPSIMSYLYGHIMHRELDRKCHPFINYMTDDVRKHSIVNFHLAFEEYLGDFILKNKLGLSRRDFFKDSKFASIGESLSLDNLMDKVYSDTYGYSSASDIMRRSLTSIKNLNLLRNLLESCDSTFYYRLIGLEKYLKIANLDVSECANTDKKVWCDPISREKHSESFLELFDEACESSKEIMESVDDVVYGNKPLSSVNSIFDNSSYDTGIPCEIGSLSGYSRYKSLGKRK